MASRGICSITFSEEVPAPAELCLFYIPTSLHLQAIFCFWFWFQIPGLSLCVGAHLAASSLSLLVSWTRTHTQPLPCRADHSCALVLQDLMVCLLSINTVSYGNLPKISQTSQSLLSRSSRLEFSAPLGSQTQATNSSLLWKLPILSVTHRAATPWLKLHTSTRAGLKISIYPLPCPARLLEVEGFFLSFFLYSFPVDFFPLCC